MHKKFGEEELNELLELLKEGLRSFLRKAPSYLAQAKAIQFSYPWQDNLAREYIFITSLPEILPRIKIFHAEQILAKDAFVQMP